MRALRNGAAPELLSPAGDWERLEMALHYGADAVYLAGRRFGLRAGAGNFGPEELQRAVAVSHRRGVKVYVAVNALPHEGDTDGLPEHLERCAEAGADALIVADLGVLALAKKHAPGVPLHVSTQFGVVNAAAAQVLYALGAKRVILARELTLPQIRAIRKNTPPELELEAFVHGAMCVSFSGRCLLSNYLTGRDGNGGACAQPCRWRWHLTEERRSGERFDITEDSGGTYILNSRDLCMIAHLRDLLEAGVCSFKLEGRTKSAYYAAAATNAYRHAIDDLAAGRPFDPFWYGECGKLSHRPYSTGFYYGSPGQYTADSRYFSDADICAVVEECTPDGLALVTERNRFSQGDALELLRRDGKPLRFCVSDLRDGGGAPLDTANRPMVPLRLRLPVYAPRLSILRRLRQERT
ncbi:MAG: U32 family peptidase [Oscillospiraceae bacterium]|nr:U32 family peptidase [Oscillospiraceae bacterium]